MWPREAAFDHISALSRRQREVQLHLGSGKLNKQDAYELGISERRVAKTAWRPMQSFSVSAFFLVVRRSALLAPRALEKLRHAGAMRYSAVMPRLDATTNALAAEPLIRLGAFAAVLLLLMAWELLAPRRHLTVGRWRRWPGNAGVVVINTLLLRIVFPTAAVGLALVAEGNGWGLLNWLAVPDWLAILSAIILLDLIIYAQHVLFHANPLLWRLHRMHHADLDIDVTTGIRFHPVEILLSTVIKLGAVAVLGVPPLAVMFFEILLNATSMFNHSNIRLSAPVDGLLRRILVTPDMHRIHHSIVTRETNSNFGFSLPWWDHLFGTYRPQPAAGHEGMTIGLAQFREPAELRLDRMLMQPLRPERPKGEQDDRRK